MNLKNPKTCPHPEEKRETRITGGSVEVEETEDTCTQCGKIFNKRFET